jgi:DNA repair protein RecO (recombination protein O)
VATITVTGMVLKAMPIGEYDRRLVILTKERGKIATFAKGARRQNSAFLACSQPFAFGKFELYEGRTSFNLASAFISNYFQDVMMNLEAAYFGMYFCELVDYFAQEFDDGREMLNLLYASLRALLKESIGMKLVRYIFELRLFVINGLSPQVFQCVKCGKEKELASYYKFSSRSGGLLCASCTSDAGDTIRIGPSTIYTLQFIVTAPIEKLYSFTVSDEVLRELKRCMDQYRKLYIDKEIKSLKVIEKIL